MEPDSILQTLNLESEIVPIIILTIGLGLILYASRKQIRARYHEWRIEKCLDGIGSEQIRDLQCPDGLDGYHQMDRVALTPESILIINYKRFGGIIYCAEHISEWTQVIGQKSFKFDNPLFELDHQLTSLRLQLETDKVGGILFFGDSAAFPKGRPELVWQPDTVPDQYRRANCAPPKPDVQAAWEKLKAMKIEGFEDPAYNN